MNKKSLSRVVRTTQNRADHLCRHLDKAVVTKRWHMQVATEAFCVLCERSNNAASNSLTAPGCFIATVVQAELPVVLPLLPHTAAICRPCPFVAASSPPPPLRTSSRLRASPDLSLGEWDVCLLDHINQVGLSVSSSSQFLLQNAKHWSLPLQPWKQGHPVCKHVQWMAHQPGSYAM